MPACDFDAYSSFANATRPAQGHHASFAQGRNDIYHQRFPPNDIRGMRQVGWHSPLTQLGVSLLCSSYSERPIFTEEREKTRRPRWQLGTSLLVPGWTVIAHFIIYSHGVYTLS